jgi:hypothetical protein
VTPKLLPPMTAWTCDDIIPGLTIGSRRSNAIRSQVTMKNAYAKEVQNNGSSKRIVVDRDEGKKDVA